MTIRPWLDFGGFDRGTEYYRITAQWNFSMSNSLISPIKTSQTVIEEFVKVENVLAQYPILGRTVLINYNLRGYEHFDSTYPQEWQDEYVENNFQAVDPVAVWSFIRQGVCRWSEIGLPDPFKITKKGAKYGLNFGATWCRKTGPKRSVVYIARSDREFKDEEIESISDAINPFFDIVTLTEYLAEGEFKVIQELVKGHTTADIAETLNISESAVKQRVSSARKKMGSKNTPQLIEDVFQKQLLL